MFLDIRSSPPRSLAALDAQEVKALADAHERELELAMASEDIRMNADVLPDQGRPSAVGAVGGAAAAASGGGGSDSNDAARDSDAGVSGQKVGHASAPVAGGVGEDGSAVGLEFWSRQSDLWSGVFTEQQTGLLQMVRAQEAELRQGKLRISSLEQELSALNDRRAELERSVAAKAATSAEGAGAGVGALRGGGKSDDHRPGSLREAEANDWRQRLERMQADHERRLSVLQEREAAVAAAELRVESRARELGAERDRLTAGAVALSAEADGLR